jgi:predicted transcriptional regulator
VAVSPENADRVKAAQDAIAREEADNALLEPVLYTLEPISIDDAAHELARAEGRLKSALSRLRNCGAVDRNVRNDVTREVSQARTEAMLSAWRLRALQAEAG